MDDDAEIIAEFLVESHENLDQLDRDLVELEREPGSRELLSSIFRTIHTIKGTSGFLAFNRLEALTHVGENLLSRLRDGEMEMTAPVTESLLTMVDTVRALLNSVEACGKDTAADVDIEPVVAALKSVLGGPVTADVEPLELQELEVADEVPTSRLLGEILVERGVVTDTDIAEALVAQAGPTDEDEPAKRGVVDASVRVDVDLLDSLVQLVGELVLTRNQLLQRTESAEDIELVRAAQRLDLVASELQEGIMKARMQPIGQVWSKMPRIVRDLGVQLGRDVDLQMEGHETELDRSLLEALKGPLTHLVRNALDHGIEKPEDRVAAGKPAQGRLCLRAFHESGQVVVEITDDGKGIDTERILEVALNRGVVTREQAAAMGPRDILNLIFRPGFSTATEVTNVSGRGVGMDVVRTNIERIGGTVDMQSEVGAGTTCRVRIPLTLAIIPALTISCAGDHYAIPQVNLLELVRLEGDALRTGIEEIHGAPVHRLRGNLLPLVHLDDELDLVTEAEERRTLYIVVLQAEDRQFGLVVHDVVDTQEIVVKPLSSQLKSIGCYAGATILGDGSVALILDVLALAKQANVLVTGRDRSVLADGDAGLAGVADDVESLLVVGVGEGRRLAMPLAMVTRLEEFSPEAVEHVGSREVVQYRDQILPLVRVGQHVGATSQADPSARLQVVVYSERGRSVGLVVDRILDITEQRITARSDVDEHGLLGSAVVHDRITELLDVRQAILAADPNFYTVRDAA